MEFQIPKSISFKYPRIFNHQEVWMSKYNLLVTIIDYDHSSV